jgi:hypothetical protein
MAKLLKDEQCPSPCAERFVEIPGIAEHVTEMAEAIRLVVTVALRLGQFLARRAPGSRRSAA